MRLYRFITDTLYYITVIRYTHTYLSVMARRLTYRQYGEPINVLSIENYEIPIPNNNEVLVEMLAAPVNPVDFNIIQGVYIIKQPLPAVPGYEGVGRIKKVGSKVSKFVEGDHVIFYGCIGAWRTHLTTSEHNLFKIPDGFDIAVGATLGCNPPSVYRMLKDFVKLKSGDTVIQNAANSSCGQLVIQMCKLWGINTVNVVRTRPELDELKSYLKNIGATYVFTENEIGTTDIFKTGKLTKPKLALNCVGGQCATNIMKHLENGGTMVTYGGMAMMPISVPTTFLVFKEFRMVGFNFTQWTYNEANFDERDKMYKELLTMFQDCSLKVPSYKIVSFDNYAEALSNTLTKKGMVGKKYILKLSED